MLAGNAGAGSPNPMPLARLAVWRGAPSISRDVVSAFSAARAGCLIRIRRFVVDGAGSNGRRAHAGGSAERERRRAGHSTRARESGGRAMTDGHSRE